MKLYYLMKIVTTHLKLMGTLVLLIVRGGQTPDFGKIAPLFQFIRPPQIMKFVLDFLKSTKYGPNSFIFMRFGAYFPYFCQNVPLFQFIKPPQFSFFGRMSYPPSLFDPPLQLATREYIPLNFTTAAIKG